MAITDIAGYAHLSDADIDSLACELDSIRSDVEADRGASDARYIHRAVALQRSLEVAGRAVLVFSRRRPAWIVGTGLLACAKIIENMELGHNIMHGQWDWMNDPELHSAKWEWDQVGPSAQWKQAHNYSHHVYTNIVGMDDDIGFGVIRMTRDVPWRPINALQPLANIVLALTFEWGIARHDLDAEKAREAAAAEAAPARLPAPRARSRREFSRKIGRQLLKDFVVFPALTGPAFRSTMTANLTANVLRNLWAYVVIFCGHFPDGAEKFTMSDFASETRPLWYLRQMLGSANFRAGPVMAFMSGNLCYQIEHHLFPDLPSNRYRQISRRVQALCERYDLPYTTGSLAHQYLLALRTVHKLALPDRFLRRSSHDAPETGSEQRFRSVVPTVDSVSPGVGRRTGLRSALAGHPRQRVAAGPTPTARTSPGTALRRYR
ncbi:Fatty acid desaturase [Gordonia terrae C-6]|uniref:Fatty acid desaturase n=1 Tax=Gordonia terrae C-6 TaxID=1316928 RepID=R7YAB3_9ACTN|nr:Fatty acid desaturase [Gordonia terrae C-6]